MDSTHEDNFIACTRLQFYDIQCDLGLARGHKALVSMGCVFRQTFAKKTSKRAPGILTKDFLNAAHAD